MAEEQALDFVPEELSAEAKQKLVAFGPLGQAEQTEVTRAGRERR
jgi:hypothetical protein